MPAGMAYDPVNKWLLVAEAGINAVGVIDTATNAGDRAHSRWLAAGARADGRRPRLRGQCARARHRTRTCGALCWNWASRRSCIRARSPHSSCPRRAELPKLTAHGLCRPTAFVAQPDAPPLPARHQARRADREREPHLRRSVRRCRRRRRLAATRIPARRLSAAGALRDARAGRGQAYAFQRAGRRRHAQPPRDRAALGVQRQFLRRFRRQRGRPPLADRRVSGSADRERACWRPMAGQRRVRARCARRPGRLSFAESNSSTHPEEQPEAGTLWHHLERNGIAFRNFGEGFELAGNVEDQGRRADRRALPHQCADARPALSQYFARISRL